MRVAGAMRGNPVKDARQVVTRHQPPCRAFVMSQRQVKVQPMTQMSDDIMVACMDLVGRAGAKELEFGYVHEGVPVEEAGWYAHAQWQGTRIIVQDHRSPSGAMLALAERLLFGAQCRCGKQVTLTDETPGCRWTLNGKRWEPGCDAPPMKVDGDRGDVAAMQRAARQRQLLQPTNRAERRAQQRRRR